MTTIDWIGHYTVIHPDTGEEYGRYASFLLAFAAAEKLSSELAGTEVLISMADITAGITAAAADPQPQPEPEPEPEPDPDEDEDDPGDPSDPVDPPLPDPGPDIPTPDPGWFGSLLGRATFREEELSDEARPWFRRATNRMPGYHGGKDILPYLRNLDAGGKQPTYGFARTGGLEINALLTGLRSTGYLGFLDGACDILDIYRDRLKGPVTEEGYTFRYFPEHDTIQTLDELLLHGYIANAALACHVNRGKPSPAKGNAGRAHDYGAIADFWFEYLENDFPNKWWSGGKGSEWNFSMNGGMWKSGGGSRAAEPGKWPFIWRHFRHVTWPFALYYNALYRRTGKTLYHDLLRSTIQRLWDVGEPIGTASRIWQHGDSTEYASPSTYATYVTDAVFHLWCEGQLTTQQAKELTGFVWEFMPVNGWQSFEDNTEAVFGGSFLGGAPGEREKHGYSLPDIDDNDLETQNHHQQALNGIAGVWHPQAHQMNLWIYENLQDSRDEPEYPKLPIVILAGIRYRKASDGEDPLDPPEPEPDPTDPVDPDLPDEPPPPITPPAQGQTTLARLEVVPGFDPNDLPEDEVIWFERATTSLPGNFGGRDSLDRIRSASVDRDKNPTYTLARSGGAQILNLIAGLRATGYSGFLDGIADILDAIGTHLRGPTTEGGYEFRYFPAYNSLETLDEMLLHGHLAAGVLALDANRHSISQGEGAAGKVHDYGRTADFWRQYLLVDFPNKWWSGGKGSPWNFSMNGGKWDGDSDRAATPGQIPFIWRHFYHVAWVFQLYYFAMSRLVNGEPAYRELFDRNMAGLLKATRDAGSTSRVWSFGERSEYLMPSTYVRYVFGAVFELWAHGEIDNLTAKELTGALWELMPVNGWRSIEGNPREYLGISIAGGDVGDRHTTAGLVTAEPGHTYNERGSELDQKKYEISNFGFAGIWHDQAHQMNQWIYANLHGDDRNPDETMLPVCILASLRHRKGQ